MLEGMTENQREVLVLCDVEERTDEEVAALLGVPSGTVKSRLRLARASFRQGCARHAIDVGAELSVLSAERAGRGGR